MRYKLNQQVWIISDYLDFVQQGKITSIQTTKYEPNETFPEGSEYVKYRVNQSWEYEDVCFDTEQEAKKVLIYRLENKVEQIKEELRRLRK